MVTAGPYVGLHDALAVRPAQAHAEHVGHGRAAAGPGLAGQQAPYDDPGADDVGAQPVGLAWGGHAGILGWAVSSNRADSRRYW